MVLRSISVLATPLHDRNLHSREKLKPPNYFGPQLEEQPAPKTAILCRDAGWNLDIGSYNFHLLNISSSSIKGFWMLGELKR